jgi:hypothetical protein
MPSTVQVHGPVLLSTTWSAGELSLSRRLLNKDPDGGGSQRLTQRTNHDWFISTISKPQRGQHTSVQPFCSGQDWQAVLAAGSKICPHMVQVSCFVLINPILSARIPG